jgi:tetratricopeptide (TPR) repeat protein
MYNKILAILIILINFTGKMVLGQINWNLGGYVSPNTRIQAETIPLEQMMNTANVLQARYDRNRKFRDELIVWITDLKGKTNEENFHKDMNIAYSELNSMDEGNFHKLGDELNRIKRFIDLKIDQYNSRLAERPNILWNEANSLLNKGIYDKAIIKYNELITINPEFMASYRNRGICYFSMSMYVEAIADLSKFINSDQSDAHSYRTRGWAYYQLENINNALTDFEMQVKIKPTDEAYYNRGSAKAQMDNNVGAISDYTKAINLNPNFSMAYNNRGWAKFQLKNNIGALADLNKAIELDPNNYVAFDSRQEVKFAMGNYNGCLSDCNSALEINKDCSNAMLFRGRVYYIQKNKAKACEDWNNALNIGSTKALGFINKHCK